MRTLMTLMTLAAAGAGYAYLQQPCHTGDASVEMSTTSLLQSDGNREHPFLRTATHGSVKDLVNRVHEHTKSVLDEFANQHGGHSDAPADDAFQRLRQITQSAAAAFASDDREKNESVVERTRPKPTRLPPTKLDDLQRIAFSPNQSFELAAQNLMPDEPDQGVAGSSATPVHTNAELINAPEIASQSNEASAQSPVQIVAEEFDAKKISHSPDSNELTERTTPEVTHVSQRDSQVAVKHSTAIAPSTAAAPPNSAEWKVIGKTTEGRKMHSMHLGTMGLRTMIIAGIDGEDRTAVRWLEMLADSLAKRPNLTGNLEIVLFRAGNPDGLVKRTKANARGVPLNRNFPTRQNLVAPGVPPFAAPGSEAETRVILETISSFRPRRVIHLASTSNPSHIIHNRMAKSVALELERTASFKLVSLDPSHAIGSLEDFVNGTLEGSMLTIRINPGSDWQQAWNQLQPQLLSAVVGQPVDANESFSPEGSNEDGAPIPFSNFEPVSRSPRRRGYEEMPAPPQ